MKKYIGPASFYKSALLIALPVMGQSLIENLVSLIDNFMVSGLGDVKMSGVNIAGQLIFVFLVLMSCTCTCGGIFLTQFLGAEDGRGMRQAVSCKIVMNAFICALYMACCMIFPRKILSLLVIGNSQAQEILDQGVRYMFIIGFAGIPMMISHVIASSLRETGKVNVPLKISLLATLINTALNWVLIYGNLGMPRLEVAGAAIASVIARVVEAVLYIVVLYRTPQPFTPRIHDIYTLDRKLFITILWKGLPIIGSEMMWVISETVTTALYNGRGGADVVSGMAASFSIANLYFVAFGGITTAASIIIGKSLGAGELDQARRESRWIHTGGFIFGVIMMLFGFLTMLIVPLAFGSLSAHSQEICRSMVFWMAVLMPVWVYQNVQLAVSRAGGDTRMGLVIDGGCTLVIVYPLMFILAWGTSIGPVAMYIITKLVDIPKTILQEIWMKKERWVKNLARAHASEASC